jgi:hypothetical protein
VEGAVIIEPALQPSFITPASHGWNLVRSVSGNGIWDVHALENLEEAANLLNAGEEFVLGLPINMVLAQRLRLPTVDPQDFPEMVRIQVEKSFPYSPDEVTTDYEIIEQTESDSVISAVAVHNERLSEMAAPLLLRGHIPSQVTVYAAQRAATHAAEGRALLIYPEGEKLISAISENGKLSLTRTLDAREPEQLQRDLPQLTLSAELQGINSSFPSVLLDEACLPLRDTVESLFSQRPELVSLEMPPAPVKLNLLPEQWKQQRVQLVRRAEWRQRLLWAGGAYAAALVLFFGYVFAIRLMVGSLDKRVARDASTVAFVKKTEATWKALAPAIDPRYYPVEVLLHLFESLPNQDVRITAYKQSARQIQIEGEALSAALAYEFAENIKKNRDLRAFAFEMGPPRILPNDHAQFRLEAKPK